jgi:Zn-dependent M28 family amino/carboxypeptidase
MVMEVARSIADSSAEPERTIVFAHFAGEELGLLGSKALVETLQETPPFHQGKVVAMLNLDMVGRYREDPGLSIGAVSTSPGWGALLDAVDPRGLVIVRDPAVNNRSDHASFSRVGIPVLFFFTGLHRDYHRTSDELDGINADGMNRIAQYVLDVALRLGSGPALPRKENSAADSGGDAPPADLP